MSEATTQLTAIWVQSAHAWVRLFAGWYDTVERFGIEMIDALNQSERSSGQVINGGRACVPAQAVPTRIHAHGFANVGGDTIPDHLVSIAPDQVGPGGPVEATISVAVTDDTPLGTYMGTVSTVAGLALCTRVPIYIAGVVEA